MASTSGPAADSRGSLSRTPSPSGSALPNPVPCVQRTGGVPPRPLLGTAPSPSSPPPSSPVASARGTYRRRRSVNPYVAEPTPDVVPPRPVPLWSLLPLPPPPPDYSDGSSFGYFDIIPSILSETDAESGVEEDDLFGSPMSISTIASSLRSREAGRTSRTPDTAARPPTPTSQESGELEASKVLGAPKGDSKPFLGEPPSPSPPHSRFRRLSLSSVKAKRDAETSSRASLPPVPAWRPNGFAFYDCVKVDDPTAAPLPTRKATVIPPSALDSLLLSRQTPEAQYHCHERSTSVPVLVAVPAPIFGSSPRHPRRVRLAARETPTSEEEDLDDSIPRHPSRSSSIGTGPSDSRLVTSPFAALSPVSTSRATPVSVQPETSPIAESPGDKPLVFLQSPRPAPLVPLPAELASSVETPTSSASILQTVVKVTRTTGTVSRRPSLFRRSSSQPATPKNVRREIEFSIGASLLRAAGATEAEVSLRAKSVGWEALGRHDQMKKEAMLVGQRKRKMEQRSTFAGGMPLVSKFSLE